MTSARGATRVPGFDAHAGLSDDAAWRSGARSGPVIVHDQEESQLMSAALLEQHLASVARIAPRTAHAADAERERRLPQPIVRAMTEAGLFRLYVPHSLGGSQLSPLEFAEILRRCRASTARPAGAPSSATSNTLFTTPMQPAAIERIFLDQPGTVTGLAFFPFGRAVRTDGGFRLSGRWQFASGCQHCRWYFVLCQEYQDGEPQFSASGVPLTRACFLPLEAYTIEETWDVSGLSGSGSHDVILDDVFVPEDMTWIFGRSMRRIKHFGAPMHRMPPYATGVMQAGFIGIGIAQGAIDHAMEIAQTKLGVGTVCSAARLIYLSHRPGRRGRAGARFARLAEGSARGVRAGGAGGSGSV